ncbi:type II toxin-antitoxin system TacA family antitoxin [Brucella cytisi]|uniref:type II toxin-antitoxin system TacA family antitoxin n=1 Tax=Brucella cytisi TaxID=407152 RepID=UPI0035D56084
MASTAERKEYPISMRLPEADVAMIDRAATLRGRSRTDFVRDAAVRAAEEVVMEQSLIRMSPEGFDAFMEVLAAPAAPVPEMVELAKRPAPWDAGYEPKR